MSGHVFHPSILREYDVRGIVGDTLFPADAHALGRALGELARRRGGRSAIVGRDGRLSSPELEAAAVAGLRAAGLSVTRIGCGPSPMLYYAATVSGADAALMVTGSHNPPNHNGFKMLLDGKALYGADIAALGPLAAQGLPDQEAGPTPGPPPDAVREWAVLPEYVARLLRDDLPTLVGGKPLTVVWDAGNGAAGEAMAALTATLTAAGSGRHILLNERIDGTFPAHHPDPTEPETLHQLMATVRAEGADLGVAFDGDGDRLGVVDGRGRIVWGDQILQILAEEVLATHPGAAIIADVKASQVLFDEVARLGGVPVMWKTGHSLIKAKMAETGAPLAGEMSGHLFFADRWYGFDDGLYAAVRLLALLSRGGESLTARFDRLPRRINTPELRFPCADDRKFAIIERIRDRLRRDGAEVSDVDGVRVRCEGGWWLLRASNTQAVLVARAEAETQAGLDHQMAALRAHLAAEGMAGV